MRTSDGISHDVPSSSWLSSSFNLLCAPLVSCLDWKPRRSKSTSLTTHTSSISWPLGRSSDQDLLIDEDDEKHPRPVYEQPIPQAAPLAATAGVDNRHYHNRQPSDSERPPRKSFASGRTMQSMKKRFRSDGSSARRPQISAPSDFRHLESSSFQFPPPAPVPVPQYRQRGGSDRSMYRPLELSIYQPSNRMSPILPLFDFPRMPLPEPAHLQDRLDDNHQLLRQRSNSSMPFHIPRKRAAGSPVSSARDLNSSTNIDTYGNEAPAIPTKSLARARANTSPDVEILKSRVASAMIEVDKLQKQIDDVIERQSLYASSRPSTAHSMARTMPELEPMPDIPALPPSAPSFAERLNSDLIERPQTAPLKTALDISNRSQDFGEQHTAASTPTRLRHEDPPLAPPLPLVLRPPLRKKKSFSRVSTWLFPNSGHNRDLSFESVTNQARPIKGTDGFFQPVTGGPSNNRMSFESVDTVSTWETEDEHRTVPTTWSPGSTPLTKQEEAPLQRVATFGYSPRSSSRPFRSNAIVAS